MCVTPAQGGITAFIIFMLGYALFYWHWRHTNREFYEQAHFLADEREAVQRGETWTCVKAGTTRTAVWRQVSE